MRLLAIGDIHGCFRSLVALVDFVGVSAEDTLVTLGDYVDRGPASYAVIEWLIRQRGRCNLISLTGNHEVMMLRARESEEALREWKRCGGKAALRSYSPVGDKGRLVDVPDNHWDFLRSTCVPHYESERHLFAHAGILPDCPLADQPDYMLFWAPFGCCAPHQSGKTLICGHQSQKSGLPSNNGYVVCIDTWAHGGGWLTCLDVESGEFWQANEAGAVRSSHLFSL